MFKRIAVAALFTLSMSALVLADDEAKKPKQKGGPNPLHAKVSAQVPGVIVFLGTPDKPLAVGDRVTKGQIVAQLDDRLARLDVEAAKALLAMAHADHRAAQHIAQESQTRMVRAEQLFRDRALSREDKDAAVLTFEKYSREATHKASQIQSARVALDRAQLIVEMHQLRSPLNGVVRAIYKIRGEGAKALNAILLIEETPAKE